MKNLDSLSNTLLTAGCCAVTHIPNCCMTALLSLFTLVRVPKARRNENLYANQEVLMASAEKSGFFIPGRFIENQNEWEAVRFGTATMRYSGCEIMAVYNALLDLGVQMTACEMAALISEFERKGAEIGGRWGCSPLSIRRYFTRRGYRVSTTTSIRPEKLNTVGENSDTVIITAYNDRNDIRRMIHTVSVTKDENGSYVLHNAYKRINGVYAAYKGDSPVTNLQEAIAAISQGQAAAICITGISKHPRTIRKILHG